MRLQYAYYCCIRPGYLMKSTALEAIASVLASPTPSPSAPPPTAARRRRGDLADARRQSSRSRHEAGSWREGGTRAENQSPPGSGGGRAGRTAAEERFRRPALGFWGDFFRQAHWEMLPQVRFCWASPSSFLEGSFFSLFFLCFFIFLLFTFSKTELKKFKTQFF